MSRISGDTANQDVDKRLEVRANASEASSHTLDDRTLFLESKRAKDPIHTSSERAGLSHEPKVQPTNTHALAPPAPLNYYGYQAMLAGPVGGEASSSSKPIFPEFLMEVINDEAGQDVLRWMPCGTKFFITDYRKFVNEQMEKLFHIKHMSSFVRKLSRWGFEREFEDGNLDIFRHPYFRRDQPTLCRSMKNVIGDRPKKSKKKIKQTTADHSSPYVHEVSPTVEPTMGQRDHRYHTDVLYHQQYAAFMVPQQHNNRLNYHRNTSAFDNSRSFHNNHFWGS